MAADFTRDATPGATFALAMFTGMRTTLDTVIQLDLERPLGTDLAAARGERARAWRGDLSLPLIAAAMDTVERVYTAPGGFSTQIQASAELSAFDAVLRGRLQAARAAMPEIREPLQVAVGDPAARPQVEKLLDGAARACAGCWSSAWRRRWAWPRASTRWMGTDAWTSARLLPTSARR